MTDVDEEELDRDDAAREAINAHCEQNQFFAHRLRVPGAQLGSVPFYCNVALERTDVSKMVFFFCLDPELNAFRIDPEVMAVARECVAVAVSAVPGLGMIQHEIKFQHAGYPPVPPDSLPRPPPTPLRQQVAPVSPEEAALIATGFLQNHVDAHTELIDEIKKVIPGMDSLVPVEIDDVLWVRKEGKLVIYVGFDREFLSPLDVPECVEDFLQAAVKTMHVRYPEVAAHPWRLFYVQ